MSNKRRIKRPPMAQASPVMDQVSDQDRQYFEAHPYAKQYTRAAVAGEFGDNVIPRGAVVTVFQVAPGVRIRRVLE